jgi:hypothetical protein
VLFSQPVLTAKRLQLARTNKEAGFIAGKEEKTVDKHVRDTY